MSATTTFDIFVNYTRFPIEMVEDLENHLDDPSNGISLENDAHDAFDMFDWCLKATGVSIMAFDYLDIADGASRKTQSRFSTEEQLYYSGIRKTLSLSETKVTMAAGPLDLLASGIAIFLCRIRDTSQFILPWPKFYTLVLQANSSTSF